MVLKTTTKHPQVLVIAVNKKKMLKTGISERNTCNDRCKIERKLGH